MDFKSKIFSNLVGKLSIIFLITYTISYVIGDLIYGLKKGGSTIYFSIFFIVVILISSVVLFFLLLRLESKFFLYILLALPILVFCVMRFFELFSTPADYIAEIILMVLSVLLSLGFLVTAFFVSEEKISAAKEKKREEIVKSVLESQDKYQKALERKRAEWENVIEEEVDED